MHSRRRFLKFMGLYAGLFPVFPQLIYGKESCSVQHPLIPPNKKFKDECHNCGMHRSMWARTWYTYTENSQEKHVCSIHCLAEALSNSGIEPRDLHTALYQTPESMIAVQEAIYVVGSKANGTMSMKSKLAFSTQKEANVFIMNCGGEVTDFNNAYKIASNSIPSENKMIGKNRIRKGKIIEPIDKKDACPVCGMFPARYPKNKCQLTLENGEVIHFCATHCLFKYLNKPQEYTKSNIKKNLIWVIDFKSGEWIYAPNAYYVIGSQVKGPMGKEAFAFINKKDAISFQAEHNGRILRFPEIDFPKLMKT